MFAHRRKEPLVADTMEANVARKNYLFYDFIPPKLVYSTRDCYYRYQTLANVFLLVGMELVPFMLLVIGGTLMSGGYGSISRRQP